VWLLEEAGEVAEDGAPDNGHELKDKETSDGRRIAFFEFRELNREEQDDGQKAA
jgi:hypothetical protein